MNRWAHRALVASAVSLPVFLVYSSLRTLRSLEEQKEVYLRSRAATIAGRLETLPDNLSDQAIAEVMSEQEPGLVALQLIQQGGRGDEASLETIWRGSELFRIEQANGVFRAHVPFHFAGSLRIARIDLAAAAADFLVEHAWHNVIFSALGSAVLMGVALYAAWIDRRSSRLEQLAGIGKLASVLAHEIRNPLGTIKGFAQLLGEQAADAARPYVETILAETQRLEHLVRDLLLYGRPPQPAMRIVQWDAIAGALRRHAEQMIGARPIRFTMDTPGFAWRTDPDLLGQALLNLVRNAVEAIGDSGEVRVLAEATNGGVRIAVADDGPGIPPHLWKSVREPFFTTKAQGTGLGLAIAGQVARALGGRLDLRNREPRGVEAVLWFPHVRGE